jgi:hemerythrin-like metal-binding protein
MRPFRDLQVDTEHSWIIQFFEQLRERGTLDDGDPAVAAELSRCLLSYLTRHCQREEELMAAQGYQGADRHAQAHQALQQEFNRVLLPRLRGYQGLAEDLRLVRELFLRHIVTWDEAFGEWLEQRTAVAATSGRAAP